MLCGPLCAAAGFIKHASERTREKCESMKITFFYNPIQKQPPSTFSMFYSLEVGHSMQPTLKGKIRQRYEFQEVRILGGPVRCRLPHSPKLVLKTVMDYSHLDQLLVGLVGNK